MEEKYYTEVERNQEKRNKEHISELFERRKEELNDEYGGMITEIILTSTNKIKFKVDGDKTYTFTTLE